MTEFQGFLTAEGLSPRERYQALAVGSPRLADLIVYEIFTLLVLPLPGALGYALRQKLLPRFLDSVGRAPVVGKGLTVRHPKKIRLGNHVVLDDDVVLDSKGDTGGITIGDRVLIGRQTILSVFSGTLEIGDGCNLGSRCRVATRSRLVLGRSVLIAANCYLGAPNHRFERIDVPVIAQGTPADSGGLEIADNVWIGAGVTVLDGVRIGRDAIIGAHSLVTRDVPPYAIAAGAPARVIRMRDGAPA